MSRMSMIVRRPELSVLLLGMIGALLFGCGQEPLPTEIQPKNHKATKTVIPFDVEMLACPCSVIRTKTFATQSAASEDGPVEARRNLLRFVKFVIRTEVQANSECERDCYNPPFVIFNSVDADLWTFYQDENDLWICEATNLVIGYTILCLLMPVIEIDLNDYIPPGDRKNSGDGYPD